MGKDLYLGAVLLFLSVYQSTVPGVKQTSCHINSLGPGHAN